MMNKEKAQKYYEKALSLIEEYRKKYPNRWREKIFYEYDYMGAIDDMDEIFENFAKALEEDENFVNAYIERAYVYEYKTEYRNSIDDLSKALTIEPNNQIALYNRANMYFYIAQYDKAITDYKKVIEFKPDDYSAYYNLGMVYQNIEEIKMRRFDSLPKAIKTNKNLNNAIFNYSKAIENNKKHYKAWFCRGYLYMLIGNHKKAVIDFKAASALGDHNAKQVLEKLYEANR